MSMSDTGIKEKVICEIQELACRHRLKKVILFGSRARGDYRRTSDIDLAVSGGNIAGFSLDIEEEISTLLKFDIVDLDGAVQPELLREIEKDGRMVYEQI